jgi:hydroxyacylglutathione hydrolase
VIRLTDDISLVGGGPISGAGLTEGPDSHVYLLDGGSSVALVDSGLGSAGSMARIMERIGPSLSKATDRSLLLTHAHADHAGGAAAFRQQGFRVHASREVAAAVEAGDDIATGTAAGRAAGLFPADYLPTPCPVDVVVDDEQVIEVGRLRVRVIATPGHAAGHVAYLVDGPAGTALLSGDTLFLFGRILLQPVPDCDLYAHVRSLRRLGQLAFDALLPGHGGFVLNGGGGHLGMALAALDGLRIPPNLI